MSLVGHNDAYPPRRSSWQSGPRRPAQQTRPATQPRVVQRAFRCPPRRHRHRPAAGQRPPERRGRGRARGIRTHAWTRRHQYARASVAIRRLQPVAPRLPANVAPSREHSSLQRTLVCCTGVRSTARRCRPWINSAKALSRSRWSNTTAPGVASVAIASGCAAGPGLGSTSAPVAMLAAAPSSDHALAIEGAVLMADVGRP